MSEKGQYINQDNATDDKHKYEMPISFLIVAVGSFEKSLSFDLSIILLHVPEIGMLANKRSSII